MLREVDLLGSRSNAQRTASASAGTVPSCPLSAVAASMNLSALFAAPPLPPFEVDFGVDFGPEAAAVAAAGVEAEVELEFGDPEVGSG